MGISIQPASSPTACLFYFSLARLFDCGCGGGESMMAGDKNIGRCLDIGAARTFGILL